MIRATLRRVARRAADGYLDAAGAALGDAAAEAIQGRASWPVAIGRAYLRLVVPTACLALGAACLVLAGVGDRPA